jgi:hypothetical protein
VFDLHRSSKAELPRFFCHLQCSAAWTMQASHEARRRARSISNAGEHKPNPAMPARALRPRRLTAAERLVVGVGDGRGIVSRDARSVGGTSYVLEDAGDVLWDGHERAPDPALGTHRQRAERLLREVGLDEYVSRGGRAASVCAFSVIAPSHALAASSRGEHTTACVASDLDDSEDDFFRTAAAAAVGHPASGHATGAAGGGRRVLPPHVWGVRYRSCTPVETAAHVEALVTAAPTLPPEMRHTFLRGRDGEASAYRLREWHRRGWPSAPAAVVASGVGASEPLAPLADWLDRWARVEQHHLRAAGAGCGARTVDDSAVHNDGAALAAAAAIALLS